MKKIIKGLSAILVGFVMLFTNICSVSATSNSKHDNSQTDYSSITLESSYMTTSGTSGKSIVLKFSGSIKSSSISGNSQILLMKGSKKSIPVTVSASGSSSLVITPDSDLFTHSSYKLYVYGLKDSNNHSIKPFSITINQGGNTDEEDVNDGSNLSFTDVNNNFWAYDAIMELVDRGIIKGYSDKTFRPDATVTRSEFAAIFTKALNLSFEGTTQTFLDVDNSSWDYKAVEAAKYYMTGYRTSDGKMYFYGSNAAVREDMAVALVKALNLTVESNNTVLQQVFGDYNSISANLRDYVYTAYKNGIMVGSNSLFKPQDNLTRAEAATLMQRILDSEKVVIGSGEKVVIGGTSSTTTGDKDARLSNLWVNGSQVSGFSADIYTYNVELPAGTTGLPTVVASAYNTNGATAVVTQTNDLPGYAVVLVTSRDKTVTKTYIIYFTVRDQISSDASLSNLTVNGSTVSGFNTNTLSYNVTLQKGTTTIPQVVATVNDTGDATAVMVPAMTLPGTTTIIVTAEDGVTTRIYTIRFTVVQ